MPGLQADVNLANQLINTLFPSRNFIDQARGLVSITAIDKEQLGLTWVIDMRNLGNLQPTEWLQKKGLRFRTTSFRGQPVWTVELPGKEELALATYRNLLILGRRPYQVEAVLVGAADGNNWLKALGSPSDESGTFTVYWNPSNWGDIRNTLFSEPGQSLFGDWEKWLNSAKIVCQPDSSGLRLTGELSVAGRYLDSPSRAGVTEGALWSLLPANTAAVKVINTADNPQYFGQITGQSISRFRRFLLPRLQGPALELDLRPLNAQIAERRLHFYSFDDKDRMEEALNAWMAEVGILRSVDYQSFLLTQVNEDQSLFPWSDQNWQNPWWTIVGSYLLISQSRTTLENWIDQYTVGNTIPLTETVRQLTPSVSGGQFYFFLDWEQWRTAWRDIVKDRQLAEALPELGQSVMSIHSQGTTAELTGYWSQPQQTGAEGNLVWRQRVSDLITGGPWVCAIDQKEQLILAQGWDDQLFAYDINGKLQWQRHWDGPIISPIQTIALQDRRALVFNTRNAIYLTELDGTPIAPFPLSLRNETDQPVTVVDFSANRDYSFFTVSTDGCIYGYELSGGPIEAWSPKCNLGPIDHPLLHFQDSNRDYLVIRNAYGTVRAFARDGSPRLSADFAGGAAAMWPQFQSQNGRKQIVMASDSGLIQTLSLEGQSFQFQLPIAPAPALRMISEDFFGSSRPDFLVASGRQLSLHGYTSNGMRRQFEKNFPQRIVQVFATTTIGKDKKQIGLLLLPAERIYLLDERGDIWPGFPLAGSTAFLLTDLFQTGEQQLIVGYRDEIIVYQLGKVQ